MFSPSQASIIDLKPTPAPSAFDAARILKIRWQCGHDNLGRNSHARPLDHVGPGKLNILLTTGMLARGLWFQLGRSGCCGRTPTLWRDGKIGPGRSLRSALRADVEG